MPRDAIATQFISRLWLDHSQTFILCFVSQICWFDLDYFPGGITQVRQPEIVFFFDKSCQRISSLQRSFYIYFMMYVSPKMFLSCSISIKCFTGFDPWSFPWMWFLSGFSSILFSRTSLMYSWLAEIQTSLFCDPLVELFICSVGNVHVWSMFWEWDNKCHSQRRTAAGKLPIGPFSPPVLHSACHWWHFSATSWKKKKQRYVSRKDLIATRLHLHFI